MPPPRRGNSPTRDNAHYRASEPDAAFLARMAALGPEPGTVARDDLLRLLRMAGDTVSFVYQVVEGSPQNRLEVENEGFRGLLQAAREGLAGGVSSCRRS